MSEYNIGQRVGAAGNQAAKVLQGAASNGNVTVEYIENTYADLVRSFSMVMQSIQQELMAQEGVQPVPVAPVSQAPAPAPVAAPQPSPQGVIEANFPGTTYATPQEAQQFTQPAPAHAPAPAIPGAVDGDPAEAALWTQFFQDPGAWYDNRYDKKNPKSPDFKSKNIPQADNPQYKAGLWIGSKGQPSWVQGRLEQIGMSK